MFTQLIIPYRRPIAASASHWPRSGTEVDPTLKPKSFTLLICSSLFCAYSVFCAPHPVNDAVVPAVLSSVLEVGALAVANNCQRSCFPALNFTMPTEVPSSLDEWWCPMDCEHAFLGFSYEVTGCQSLSQLNADFANMRKTFNARYVRLYGACDQSGFYDNVIEAAWQNTLGVHALIWFGFTGGNAWETRRDTLFDTLHTNAKAPFVTRGVQFGSEPLYDDVLSHQSLTEQVVLAKTNLSDVRIPVTVSELAYGYQERGALDVLDRIDFINAHMLPFFSSNATTGGAAWPLVQQDMDWFIQNGNAKKIYFDENGWPSSTSPGVQPNTPNAVASVSSEEGYFQMLDSQCEALKKGPCGGIGWFAHIYSDKQEVGYGIYNTKGQLKFPFQPRTSC